MNNFLRGGRGMLFFENQFPSNPLTIRILSLTIIFCVLFSMVSVSPAQGQEADSLVKVSPLSIGQKVPDDFWTREHLFFINGDTVRKTLEEHRGKLLILDFWATWCGACRAWFPNNVQLQRKYANDLHVLLVNSDTIQDKLQKIEKVLTSESLFDGESGSSIIYDSYLKRLFPHRGIPFYVWIDHGERLRATTTFEFVSAAQVDVILKRKERSKQ